VLEEPEEGKRGVVRIAKGGPVPTEEKGGSGSPTKKKEEISVPSKKKLTGISKVFF